MGVNDRCAVGKCNIARKYPEKFVIKPHIFAFDTSLRLRFWKCTDPKWTFACNRKNFKFGKYNVVCSNHFEYGRPTAVSPVSTLLMMNPCSKKKISCKERGGKKSKILYSSPSKDVNDSTIIDFELSSVDIDVDATSSPRCQSLAGSLLSTSTSTAAEHDMCMLTVASSSTYSISEVIPANPISLLQ